MFTFQPIELLIVLIAGFILLAGLSLLALRRRNEILRNFLTPDEREIETEFFRRREPDAPQTNEEEKPIETTEETPQDESGWGNIAEPPLPELPTDVPTMSTPEPATQSQTTQPATASIGPRSIPPDRSSKGPPDPSNPPES